MADDIKFVYVPGPQWGAGQLSLSIDEFDRLYIQPVMRSLRNELVGRPRIRRAKATKK